MKILCIPYTYTLSHISRPLLIATELKKRGHEIIFAGDSPHDHFIKEAGFKVLPTYQVPPNVLFERIRKGKLQFIQKDELNQMVVADRDLIHRVKPDLLLTDGRFSAPVSAGIEKINHAAIVNVSSTEYRALPYIPFFDWISEALQEKLSLKKFLNPINLFLEMAVFDNANTVFKQLNKKHALRNKVTATNCLAGNDLTLLADIPEYFPTHNLPVNYQYVGPLTWKSSLPEPAWWPPEQASTLVYFTMGTTWLGGSFSTLYNSIQKNKFTAIISTGGQLPEDLTDQVKTIPGKIYIEDFVDGDLVMSTADVIVCHGGNGTIYQALQQGKPIIGIPTIPDQKFNMRRVKDLGVGEMMSLEDLEKSPEKLFDLIEKISKTSAYTRQAEEIQKILERTTPIKTAADSIERLF